MKSDAGRTDSIWTATADVPLGRPLTIDDQANVCVIGAGIAGLTTAYLLAKEGKSVVVVDDGPIAGGESGRTTAHLSNALDDRYFRLERLHGTKGARIAAQSHTEAINRIEQIVAGEKIDCDFDRLDGYLFNAAGAAREYLEWEFDAARRAGIQIEWVDRAPLLPYFDTGECLRFPNQAQFHPVKYLAGLAKGIEREGGRIYTRAHVETVEPGHPATVKVRGGRKVHANAVVVATNTPINDRVTIHTKQAPYRTYVIGALIQKNTVPKALYWDTADPYHYVRLQKLSDKHDVLIVGGEDHKTGQVHGHPEERFECLEEWARQRFPTIEYVDYRWSGQVIEPVDGLAFIGRNPGGPDNVYIVTGDSGNGMTHGTIAGILISDLIQGRETDWAKLYDPSRKTLRAIGEYTRENLNVARQYIDYVTPGDVKTEDDIPNGRGAVIRRGLQKIACYRDDHGELHEFSAVCPHLQCVVEWNATEQTWDCPCHGSRFNALGQVINGPANTDLGRADDDEPEEAAPVEAVTT
jgi:glycine/D-amino acid oxidase-like deaminating enzyme/nitrite reductase/ring-hydroxylating ferredoxin subunit